MSNSNIIITSIVLGGVATLVAGGIYLLNRPRNSLHLCTFKTPT